MKTKSAPKPKAAKYKTKSAPKPKAAKYKTWTRIPWDGNPALNLECWRKSFGRGHVSVGIGEFLNVVFSYGPDSDDSHCGTRWNYNGNPVISEDEAMRMVDAGKGKHMAGQDTPREKELRANAFLGPGPSF